MNKKKKATGKITEGERIVSPFLPPGCDYYIAPSILSANFIDLKGDISAAIDAGCRWFHLDIMDGHFVPNITFGPPLVKSIRKTFPDIFLDAHLMIENPLKFIQPFVDSGVNLITLHSETCPDLNRALKYIHGRGVYAGLSVKPKTSSRILEPVLKDVDLILIMSVEPGFGGQELIPTTLNKVRHFCLKKKKEGYRFAIEIDGGINEKTAPLAFAAGIEVFVAGSAIFGDGKIAKNIKALNRSLSHVA
ncbi:ribulose-phosphate 3-epimerase [Candidatus Sumerlaeota bacterium]|nr:ribulose-phosphate 3-epimerase [Candidatus Sumerlaeota bacterium]